MNINENEVAKLVEQVLREMTGGAPAAAPAGAGESVEAPMPGKVIRINKHVGDAVASGDEVLVLEAMKMGNPIMAPCDGKVTSMQVSEGQSVQGGDPLFTVG